jgi:hypothetical protein
MKYLLIFFLIIPLTGCSSNREGKTLLGTLTVEAGKYDRLSTPVRFECKLTDIFGDSSGTALLRDHHLMVYESGGARSKLSAQWEPKIGFNWEKIRGEGALIWILDGKTPKSMKRNFRLVLENGLPEPSAFNIQDIDKQSFLIKCKEKPVLKYNYGIIQEKEGQTGPFDRSSYIHPVWTPTGEIITGDFSPEHIWQRGIFLAWQKVKFGDIETNFWELGNSTGRTLKDTNDPGIISGPVFAQVLVYNKGSVEGRTYFKEICAVRLYNRPEQNTWMFDMMFRQWPVDPENPEVLPTEDRIMELQKVYYGGMSFRGVSPGWLYRDFIAKNEEQLKKFDKETKWLNPADSLDILTDEGYNRKNGNGIPACWIDYTGPLSDGWGGLVMFDNPSNKRYPTPLRIHPDMPYFCFAFAKDDPFTITSREPLNLTYRIVVHNGHPDKEINEQIARDFTDPPRINWKPAR